jgi:hypothetical protein
VKVILHETLTATLDPDCYGGAECDQIVHRWRTYAEGDKDSDHTHDALELDPKLFAPGTVVTVREPECPKCGEVWDYSTKDKKFMDKCRCGFDWKNWTLEQYA